MLTTPESIRIKLTTPDKLKLLGHWYLRYADGKYLLSSWRKTQKGEGAVECTDAQDGVDRMAEAIVANVTPYLQQYFAQTTELETAIARGAVPRGGFRPDYHERAHAALVNDARKRITLYRAELALHLGQLPARGWPPLSRDPWVPVQHIISGLCLEH